MSQPCTNPECHDGSIGHVAGVALICRTCWGSGRLPDNPPSVIEADAVLNRAGHWLEQARTARALGDVDGWRRAMDALWLEAGVARKWEKLR